MRALVRCTRRRYNPAVSAPPGLKRACRGGAEGSLVEHILKSIEGSKMPKLKTKSGAKKRFKVTATGKVVHAQQGKRHGMIKRTNKQIRNLRGTRIMFKTDGENVKKYFLPNA
jgi:large subunit ribosomal protein L35